MRYLGAQSNAKDLVAQEQLSALISNPMTSIRDLIVGGVGGAPTRLPGPTSEGMVLTRIGNALAWAIATGFANPMTAGGDLIIGGTNGTATRLGAGTAGQVLTMVAGAPAWVTPSGGGGGTGDFKKDGSVQMTAALNEAPMFNLESASPAENIPDAAIAAANTIKVSGATSIRYLDFGGSSKLGTKRTLIFDSVLTLYHDLDYLILPGKASITTVVGDSAEFVCEGPNPRKWRCLRYNRADGKALYASSGFTEAQVRNTPLTGLPATTGDVTETDTVLSGIGKLQASKVDKANAVTSVAGRTGAVTLTKSDVGLANADNTADSAKPVSVAQQAALDLKVNTSSVQTTQNDRTNNALMKVGAFGLGRFFDYRPLQFGGSTPPSTFFSTGTMFGFVAGGYSTQTQPGLEIPALIGDLNYGVLTVHGHWSDSTGGGGVQQAFTTGNREFTRFPASATTWLPWREKAYTDNTALVGNTTAANLSVSGPVRVGQYTLTTLPSASAFNGYEIDVTNATASPAGPKRCRSNGTNWLILNTNTPVS